MAMWKSDGSTAGILGPFGYMKPHEIMDEGGAEMGEAGQRLDAALIYEDLSTGMRARHVLECAASLFPRTPQFNMAMWRFDLLRMAEVRRTALQEASVAVIVLLSAHGSGALPRAVQIWVQRWLERKSDQPCALVVCLDERSRDTAAAVQMVSWLQARAKAKDVTVFPRFGTTPYSESDPTVQALQRRVHTKLAALYDIPRRPDLHLDWGINE
jgi:hypothetical protein